MFKNKWRKITFYIWLVSIPCVLVGGFLREYGVAFTALLVAGLIGSIVGLVILKVLGGKVK